MALPMSFREGFVAPDFREDGQEFFKHFDKIQDELGEDMVGRLKEGLDGLLLYTGLLTIANSAFLVYTLPNLKPNPADDTNALLSQLIQLTATPNHSTAFSLPSTTFSADPEDSAISRLFSVSLALSLVTSFIIIWGKQWLANWRPKAGAGAEEQRWDRLCRFLGAERWALVPVLTLALPLTLLSSLAIFGVGLVRHIATFDSESAVIPMWTLVGGVLVVLFLSLGSFWDPFCPYRTPLSDGLQLVVRVSLSLGTRIFDAWLGQPALGDHSMRLRDRDVLGTREDRNIELRSRNSSDKASADKRARLTRSPVSSFVTLVGSIAKESRIETRQRQISRNSSILHAHAIACVFNTSEDPTTLYHTAASICSIQELAALTFIRMDTDSLERLQVLFLDSLQVADRSQKGEIRDEKNVVVFGTALFHVWLSAGSWGQLLDLLQPKSDGPSHASTDSKTLVRRLKPILARLWGVQDDRFGRQPPIFTSTGLAAGLLWGCLDSDISIFYDESRLLNSKLGSISSAELNPWNQLALLALACNSRGGHTMRESVEEGFLKIQKAYNTQGPTGELADAVYQAMRGHIRERTRLPSLVFKLAWRLFVCGSGGGELADQALGYHVPFLGILEAKVRDDDMPGSYRDYFRSLRAECFELVLDSLYSIPCSEQSERSALWRSRTQFVFRAVEHYAACIMTLGDAYHVENDEALDFVRCVRALLLRNPPTDSTPSNPEEGHPRLVANYRYDAKVFEKYCNRLELFCKARQFKRRSAPDDQWCFSRDEPCIPSSVPLSPYPSKSFLDG